MKKLLLCLPLIGLPALVRYLVPYFVGAGFLPQEWDLYGIAGCLMLPFVIAVVLALLVPTSVVKRVGLSLLLVLVQFVMLFAVAPGAAESEMIGLAHRLSRESSPDELKSCAAAFRQREQAGTLVGGVLNNMESWPWFNDALVVGETQLPQNLQGRFRRVLIGTRENSEPLGVFFEMESNRGILCSTNRYKDDLWRRSIADGVYVCRYVRP